MPVLYEYFCLHVFTLQAGLSAILTVLPGSVYDLSDYSISDPRGVCQIAIFVQLGGTGRTLGIH